MTPLQSHILNSAITAILTAAITYFILTSGDIEPLPHIRDETAIRIQVQREIRSLEVIPLKNDLKSALAKMDSLQRITPKIKYRSNEKAHYNWSLSDSLAGQLYLSRIRASIPDSLRGQNR